MFPEEGLSGGVKYIRIAKEGPTKSEVRITHGQNMVLFSVW